MGFCLFNNISIMARYAQNALGLKKVMIFDFDVHHGKLCLVPDFYSTEIMAYMPYVLCVLLCCTILFLCCLDYLANIALHGDSTSGNGTHDIFYDDPSVLFVSTHQVCMSMHNLYLSTAIGTCI
mmetsp:Transcript_14462/g.34304  ORF Transcript_14462/g.34304 Transcript_14462/m.34304 type:complete len:124 (-) Transcript_14462:1188-1559(-)